MPELSRSRGENVRSRTKMSISTRLSRGFLLSRTFHERVRFFFFFLFFFVSLSLPLCSGDNKSCAKSECLNAPVGPTPAGILPEKTDANVTCSEISPFRSNGNRPIGLHLYRNDTRGCAPSKLRSPGRSTIREPTASPGNGYVKLNVDTGDR